LRNRQAQTVISNFRFQFFVYVSNRYFAAKSQYCRFLGLLPFSSMGESKKSNHRAMSSIQSINTTNKWAFGMSVGI